MFLQQLKKLLSQSFLWEEAKNVQKLRELNGFENKNMYNVQYPTLLIEKN